MKRRLLGILMIMLFLQPLALKALTFKGETCPNNAISHQQLKSNKQESPSPAAENLVLDVEDEDEFSALENNNNQDALLCQSNNAPHASLSAKQADITYSQVAGRTYSNKPLYILWSVFRI